MQPKTAGTYHKANFDTCDMGGISIPSTGNGK